MYCLSNGKCLLTFGFLQSVTINREHLESQSNPLSYNLCMRTLVEKANEREEKSTKRPQHAGV